MNKKNKLVVTSIFVILLFVLVCNYMTCFIDNKNKEFFRNFQVDSEELVVSMLRAEEEELAIDCYGLGFYEKQWEDFEPYTDDNWDRGYSRTSNMVFIPNNPYNLNYAIAGNYIKFKNGERYLITNTDVSEYFLIPILQTEGTLDPDKCGDISNITFLNDHHEEIAKAKIKPYVAQYGLQGKLFRHLMFGMPYEEAVEILQLLCALMMALVVMLISILLYKKYNILISLCFYLTFLLSPWVVNFARNLYWVEFLWFLPMLIGLFCSYKVEDIRCRLASYMLAFGAIAAKSLCGYEYISTIMLGLIMFLIVDFVTSIVKKDIDKSKLLFKTILCIGIAALCGFAVALCMHANFRGNGNLIEGIKSIYQEDVLRRTWGGDINNFSEHYRESFEATAFDVLRKYFQFGTSIVTGVKGSLFPGVATLPLIIFIYEGLKKRINVESISMYIVFFVTSISWFVLGKSHSAEHTHMNYVMWYFGFVQICFYIIIDWLMRTVSRKKGDY